MPRPFQTSPVSYNAGCVRFEGSTGRAGSVAMGPRSMPCGKVWGKPGHWSRWAEQFRAHTVCRDRQTRRIVAGGVVVVVENSKAVTIHGSLCSWNGVCGVSSGELWTAEGEENSSSFRDLQAAPFEDPPTSQAHFQMSLNRAEIRGNPQNHTPSQLRSRSKGSERYLNLPSTHSGCQLIPKSILLGKASINSVPE